MLTVIYKSTQRAGRHAVAVGNDRRRQLLDDAADRPDLLLERAGHRHRRPAELGAVGLRADHRRELAGRTRSWSSPADGATGVGISPTLAAVGQQSRRRIARRQRGAAASRGAGVHDHRAARHAALLGGIPGTSSRRRRSGSSTTRRRATSSSSRTKATSSSTTTIASEWQAANTSMSLLDGVVPYGMGPGNHDVPDDATSISSSRSRATRVSRGTAATTGRPTTTTISCSPPAAWTS